MLLKKLLVAASLLVFTGGLVAQNTVLTANTAKTNPDTVVATGTDGACDAILEYTGTPAVGQTLEICATSASDCCGCLMISATPGPAQLGQFLLPIGTPILQAITIGQFMPRKRCIAFTVSPMVQGQTFYMTVATTDGNRVSFSPALTITIQ